MLPGQRPDLRKDRRDFHRYDFDLRTLQRIEVPLQPLFRFALAQQRFTQDVDVHPHALFRASRQMLGQQIPLGRQDHVGRFAVHVLLDHRHGYAGQVAAERLKTFQGGTLQGREESGHALDVEHVSQLIGNSIGRSSAEGLIGDLHQGRLVLGTLHHAIQFRLLPPLLGRLQLGGPLLQHSGQIDRLLDRQGQLAVEVPLELVQHGFEARLQGLGKFVWHGSIVFAQRDTAITRQGDIGSRL